MPKNYREINFNIGGNEIKIAGMARPGFIKGGAANTKAAEEDFHFLSTNKYTTIISLDPSPLGKNLAQKYNINYINQSVIDFTPPQ